MLSVRNKKAVYWQTKHGSICTERINVGSVFSIFVHMHICWPPAASEDPAAGAVSGGAYGQWLICSAQPGGRLGHYHTSEKNAQTPFIKNT